MILSAASIVQTIVQATLLLAASALLVQGLIWLSRCVSANIQRIAWCLVLVQGLMFVPLSLHIPWYESPPAASATADTRLATARDLAGDSAGDRPQEHFQQATRSSPGRPSLDTAAANPLLAETMPSPASRGFTGRFAGVWQCVLLLWGLGLVSCLVVGLRRYVRFVRRIQTVESPDEEWGTQWCQLLASRGVRRAIPFRVARDVGPALIWRPSGYEVVVPEAAWRRLTAGQRRLDPPPRIGPLRTRRFVAISGRASAGPAALVQSVELVGCAEVRGLHRMALRLCRGELCCGKL